MVVYGCYGITTRKFLNEFSSSFLSFSLSLCRTPRVVCLLQCLTTILQNIHGIFSSRWTPSWNGNMLLLKLLEKEKHTYTLTYHMHTKPLHSSSNKARATIFQYACNCILFGFCSKMEKKWNTGNVCVQCTLHIVYACGKKVTSVENERVNMLMLYIAYFKCYFFFCTNGPNHNNNNNKRSRKIPFARTEQQMLLGGTLSRLVPAQPKWLKKSTSRISHYSINLHNLSTQYVWRHVTHIQICMKIECATLKTQIHTHAHAFTRNQEEREINKNIDRIKANNE